jgi:hypothetical protein
VEQDLGVGIGGGLVGRLEGTVQDCSVYNGDPASEAAGVDTLTSNQSDLASIGVSSAAGGVAGEVMSGGQVIACLSEYDVDLITSGDGSVTTGVSGLTGLGGLVGVNYGLIRSSTSFGSGGTTIDVGGSSSGSAASQTISVGGVVGTNFGIINGCASGGDVPGATGDVFSGIGSLNIGGFVGTNYGTIDANVTVLIDGKRTTVSYQSFTDANVTVPAPPTDDTPPITSSANLAGGTGNINVGGFVGANYGPINNAYAAPSFTGVGDISEAAGGNIVVDSNLLAPATGSGALGNVTIGGFVGANFSHIMHSGSEDVIMNTGSVQGIATTTETVKTGTSTGTMTVPRTVSFGSPNTLDSIMVGGFAGYNAGGGSISQSFSDSAVLALPLTLATGYTLTPTAAADGATFSMLGSQSNLVTNDGSITGGSGFQITGGFVGANYGSIAQSYATGDVNVAGTTSQSNSFYSGGFAGVNSGSLANTYAQGAVTSLTTDLNGDTTAETGVVGGLVAQNNRGTISTSYSLGQVTGGTTRGGLIGVLVSGSAKVSFWDTTFNVGLDYSAGEGHGVTGETDAALTIDSADVGSSVYAQAKWNFKTIWLAPSSAGYPLLKGVGAGAEANP